MENEVQVLESGLTDVLPSLMIPLEDRILLAPTVSVAEMVPYSMPQAIDNAPAWLLGLLRWRDQQVPLMMLEVLNGGAKPEVHRYSRIAVFNHTGVDEELPFVALLTQGIPKLARVSEEDLRVTEGKEARPFERMHVTLSGEDVVIPDITALEWAYLDWRTSNN
ncbi:chemotaxis protein CheW [Pseudomaricurvus alkylphenolicus]|jgi:chemosensory pili system protein ChpC|uniref:chemotaxis protein CheW n=1 Tax=Pseudomaricurvus alkylphenolicus TaxID=1306991 RepID=UPI0014207BDA|nr:chemotaxis protein CheW [Pseudomaricurvus alkylphenolicus]NIB39619.1 chemotaxis protein CheW [Pseudomaricurvus alkylphenolicus]